MSDDGDLTGHRRTSPFDASGINGLSYGVLIAILILFAITAISLITYCCTRRNYPTPSNFHFRRNVSVTSAAINDVEKGLDDAAIAKYPKMTYAEAKADRSKREILKDTCCSICLSEYLDDEVLRLLPDCGHVFHSGCVDTWLRKNPTCPFCRGSSSPLPQAAAAIS